MSTMFQHAKAVLGFIVLCVGLALAAPSSYAQNLRPHEPLDPAKAQSLPMSPLAIQSSNGLHKFTVELAAKQKERDTGLMHRNHLDADRGMLFNFYTEQPEKFWMRNTFIPLDMLFIRSSGVIMFIAENTTPHSETGIGPPTPVQAVLELPGGTAQRLGIKPGDVVQHAIFNNLPKP